MRYYIRKCDNWYTLFARYPSRFEIVRTKELSSGGSGWFTLAFVGPVKIEPCGWLVDPYGDQIKQSGRYASNPVVYCECGIIGNIPKVLKINK